MRRSVVILLAALLAAAPAAARVYWDAVLTQPDGSVIGARLVGTVTPSGRLLAGRWTCPACTGGLPRRAHARHLACFEGEPTVELGRYCTVRGFTPDSRCFTIFTGGTLVCTRPFHVVRIEMRRRYGGF